MEANAIERRGLRRVLFLSHLGDPSVAKGVALIAVLAILAVFLGARAFGRAVA